MCEPDLSKTNLQNTLAYSPVDIVVLCNVVSIVKALNLSNLRFIISVNDKMLGNRPLSPEAKACAKAVLAMTSFSASEIYKLKTSRMI